MAKSSRKSGGLRPRTFSGMNKKRFGASGGGGGYKRLAMKKGVTKSVMFFAEPDPDSDGVEEYDVHAFQENGRWRFIPCAEKNCPLCDADDEQMRRKSYRFCMNVYDLETKTVKVLEGGSNLATIIHAKWAKNPSKWLKRVWDITMFPTQPVTFGVDRGEDDPIPSSKMSKLKQEDLLEYITGEMKSYYGDDLSNVDISATSMDDDDDDDDEEAFEEDDFEEMDLKEVQKIAKSLNIKIKDTDGERKSKKALVKAIMKKQ